MNLIYITGSSSGLGKALAELLLEDNNNHVVELLEEKQFSTSDIPLCTKFKGSDK